MRADARTTGSEIRAGRCRPGAYNWSYRAGLTCGGGVAESPVSTTPTVQCGGMFSILPVVNLETGVMGPQAKRSSASGYLTTDLVLPVWALGKAKRNLFLFAAGYTRMFETGNALDYGLALSRPIDSKHSIQFEVRDTWVNANPNEHNVLFRVVWLIGVPD